MVDRAVCAIGGRTLVESRPGIGYLVFEVTPSFVWTQITGAMSNEFFYFIAYLSLLGASNAALAWLPLTCSAAGVVQMAVVLWRRPSDPRRRCVVDSLLGRTIWGGTILWPLAGLHWHWSTPTILTGVFVCVFITYVLCWVSNASFVSWTQIIVPRELRGVFYAWRNINSYLVVAVVLGVASACYNVSAPASHQLASLMWLLSGATVIGVVGLVLLNRGPSLTESERIATYQPLVPQLRASAGLVRLVIWSVITTASVNLSVVYQSLLYLENGASPKEMAWWQAWGQYPCMLLAILATGWALPRLHGRPVLLMAHVATIIAESSLLLLTPVRMSWMLPVVLCIFGVAKGVMSIGLIARQQELLPRGDPRLYAIFTGVSSLMGFLVTLKLPALVKMLEHWSAIHAQFLVTAPWLLVAMGVLLRVVATPLLLWSDRAPVGEPSRSPIETVAA